ncbi:TPA: SLOG family protein [Clostridium perfringens]
MLYKTKKIDRDTWHLLRDKYNLHYIKEFDDIYYCRSKKKLNGNEFSPIDIKELNELDIKPPLRIIIAGGRYFNDYIIARNFSISVIEKYIDNYEIIIVSGGATGADKIGEKLAEELGLKIERYLPNWNKYGDAAGPKRNEEMAKVSQILIAFWNGVSRGTYSMISNANKYNLISHIFRYDNPGNITSFNGKYEFLDNNYNKNIKINGLIYKNAEAAYNSFKIKDLNKRKLFTNIDGERSIKLAEELGIRNDWKSIKEEVLYRVVLHKFRDKTLTKMLLNTKGQKINNSSNIELSTIITKVREEVY